MEAINAVFKGGGAKGIAYAGALRACEEADLRFAGVAGSSAGAITALLVACGYRSDEISDRLRDALQSVGNPLTSTLAVARPSLLSSRSLAHWLDEAVAAKLGPDAPATFAGVRAASGIDLYVVCMHLATGQPVVFSPDLTPDALVVPAVVASAAIPVAFRSARVAVDGEIHRLVDGGAWANYPAFVFEDREFRAFHDLADVGGTRTVGFILGDDVAPFAPGAVPVPIHGGGLTSDRGSATRELGTLGALMSSPLARIALAIVPFVFAMLALDWLRDEAGAAFPTLARLPDAFEQVALVSVVGLLAFAITLVGAVAVVSLRLGGEIPDAGVMGVKAALGVGPSVPYWIGSRRSSGEHVAVRIPVPEGLGTLRFRPSDTLVHEAVDAGYHSAHQVLGGELPPPSTSPTGIAPGHPVRSSGRRIVNAVLSIAVLFAAFASSFYLVRRMAEGDTIWWALLVPALSTAVLLVLAARRRALRASSRAQLDHGETRLRLVAVGAAVGCVFFCFVAVFATRFSAIAEMRSDLVDGTVLAVAEDDQWSYLDIALPLDAHVVAEIDRGPTGDLRTCQSTEPCLTLATRSLGWERGDPVEVRVDADRGVAFLDRNRWSWEHWNTFPIVAPLAFVLGAMFIDRMHVLRLRRQLSSIGPVVERSAWPAPTTSSDVPPQSGGSA